MTTAGDIGAYVEHFRVRLLQDALSEATAAYWLRRAEAFEAARPRPADFTGRATTEELAEQDRRLAAGALACRNRAATSMFAGPSEADVMVALREAAAGVAA